MTTDEARRVALSYRGEFSAPDAFDRSWERFFEKTAPPNQSVQAATTWLDRDLAADQARAAGRRVAAGLGDDAPSVNLDLVEVHAIERGDLHDFRNPLLSPEQHAAICVRCQLGIRSRQLVDDRARTLGKELFPSIGAVFQRLYHDTRQRCDECGAWESDPALDACQRSFWHLPDIYLALHPGATLADMGELGPFMRGFLRRQRP